MMSSRMQKGTHLEDVPPIRLDNPLHCQGEIEDKLVCERGVWALVHFDFEWELAIRVVSVISEISRKTTNLAEDIGK